MHSINFLVNKRLHSILLSQERYFSDINEQSLDDSQTGDRKNQQLETMFGDLNFIDYTSSDTFVSCQTNLMNSETSTSSSNTPMKQIPAPASDASKQCLSPESQKRVCLVTPEPVERFDNPSTGRRPSLLKLDAFKNMFPTRSKF